MQLFYHPLYSDLTLPERHRFPIQKYQMLKAEIEGLGFGATQFSTPTKATPRSVIKQLKKWVSRIHAN